MPDFAATVAEWVLESQETLDTVIREATEDTVTAINRPTAQGGPMPVDTGFLRNSMAADLNGQGSFSTVAPASTGAAGGGAEEVALVISGMQAGDVANVAWTAVYAARVNNGFVGEDSAGRTFNQAGQHFLERGAATWQANIDAAVKRNAK